MKSIYYHNLDKAHKAAYDDIVVGLTAMKRTISIKHVKDFNPIIETILYDYPELFYVDKKYQYQTGLREIQLKPKYLFDQVSVKKIQTQIDGIVNRFIAENINEHQSDYDKALVIHDFLKKNVQYDYDALNNFSNGTSHFEHSYTAYGALVNHKCVCAGFSSAMKLICDRIGLECYIVTGIGSSTVFNGTHAWNIVKINGYYHHIDVTWDNQFSDDSEIPNYCYFNLCDESISKDHTWERKNFPVCDDEPYNYFRVNQSLMDSKAQLEKYIYENMLSEEQIIMFKVKKESNLEREIAGCIDRLVNNASAKCKHSKMEQYSYQWMPEQLVYMLKIDYR